MKMIFIYKDTLKPSKDAYIFLMNRGIDFIDREINKNHITEYELKSWITNYNVNIYDLFDKKVLNKYNYNIDTLTYDELIKLLINNNKLLIKPILISDNFFLIGFNKNRYEEYT